MRHGNVYPPDRATIALDRFFTEANLTAQRGDFAEAERIMLDLMHQAEELEHPDMLNLFWTSVRMHYIDVWTWKKHMHDEHHGET